MGGNGSGGSVEDPAAAGLGDGGDDDDAANDADVADAGVDADAAAIAPCDEIPTMLEWQIYSSVTTILSFRMHSL